MQERSRTAQQPPLPPGGVEQAPAWLAAAIDWAQSRGATDLHFFPSEGGAALWARIDGELREAAHYTPAIHVRLIARLKVLGRCTDYQGELVQEGRFALDNSNGGVEARLSILPTLHGEKAVVRLLTGGARLRRLLDLGYGDEVAAALRRAVDAPQGLLLAVGPSGSGKSTAIYAVLADLVERAGRPLSILTVEDPIEQTLPMAAQVAADPARGLGFAACLRVLLRQDPEVIMIGEIRDAETATTALQAALTGHRLLSSMHTLSAAEALVRLQQMGAPTYVIASALAGILGTRLVRLLCPECRRARPLSAAELESLPEALGWPHPEASEAVGCEACLGVGHRGRTGLADWLTLSEATVAALQAHEPSSGLAPTLRLAVSARGVALDLIREGRLAPAEWLRQAGFSSLNRPIREGSSS